MKRVSLSCAVAPAYRNRCVTVHRADVSFSVRADRAIHDYVKFGGFGLPVLGVGAFVRPNFTLSD